MTKSSGPRTEPWGIPQKDGETLEHGLFLWIFRHYFIVQLGAAWANGSTHTIHTCTNRHTALFFACFVGIQPIAALKNKTFFRLNSYMYIITARCYASAVLAMALCLSVCLSVCPSVRPSVTSRCSTKTAKRKKGKVFPYSLPSVGPGADPGVQAVSLQVT